MKQAFTWRWWWATVLSGVLGLAGCGSPTGHRILTVFFTGVDQPTAPAQPQPATKSETNTMASTFAQEQQPKVFVHKPYAERKCSACHLGEQSEKLRASGRELCFECHRKNLDATEFAHPLVKQGKCHQCHASHKSDDPSLLVRPAQPLCLGCHESARMALIPAHAAMGTTTCLGCHDPHHSTRAKMLKPAS